MTLQGVFHNHKSFVKKCFQCGHFYRYQESNHGIHNYDDRFFIGIDTSICLQQHLQHYSSIASFVNAYNSIFDEKLQHHKVMYAYLTFDVLNSNTVDFFCQLCGHHPWALVMDLNKKIALKCSINESENTSDTDEKDMYEDTVNVALFWEKFEKKILLHAFSGRAISELNLKPNFKEWAPYLGPFTRADDIVLNFEHRKINKGNGKLEEECREMSQERILEMLSNDSYLQVKNIAKRCKISTAGSKIDIIMRLKSVLTRDEEKFNKIFTKMWGHAGGWLSFSCPHGLVYYLKFLLRAESCRDYVDGCLSMAHLPNVVIVDMAHIVAKHANSSRREDIEKYNKGDNKGKLFRPYGGRAADPEIKDNVKKANDGTLSVSYPWMPITISTSKQSNF